MIKTPLNTVVGANSKLADGTGVALRSGITGEVIGSNFNARYAEMVARNQVFTVCNTGSTPLTQPGNTPSIGLVLINPPGSGKNFSILEVNVDIVNVPAGACPLVLCGNTVNTNAQATVNSSLTVQNPFIGSPAGSVAKAGSSVTLPSSTTVLRAIGGAPVANSSINTQFIRDEVAGALVLTPNTSVALQFIGATSNQPGVVASFTWAEVPV